MAAKQPKFILPSTQAAPSVLDELTGVGPGTPPAHLAPVTTATAPAPAVPAPTAPAVARTPIRVHVPIDLADRVRGAVAALAYKVPAWSSLNAATAAALEHFVAAAENEYNGGQPFEWEPGGQLRPGRRVGQ